MQYIVLDMEWNQPWPGSPSAQRVLPVQIHGEIIQIGAVRLSESGEVGDEYQVLIRPTVYKKLNRKVSSLTGIKDARLRAEGKPFPEAMAEFRAWCGEDCVYLTWGFDDIRILQENLALFSLESEWCSRWFNAQLIYNMQTDGSTAQKALKTAMAECGIEASRPAHDALGDAYHTAVICSRLDLARGTAEYGAAVRSHENGFHGAELPGCLDRHVFHGYVDRVNAMAAMGAEMNLCPVCGGQMKLTTRWYSQQGHRYEAGTACPEHGSYLVRIRLGSDAPDKVRVNRLIYAPDSDSAKKFEKTLAEKKRRPRPHRRRSKKPMKA